VHGSSHGPARIVRRVYGDPLYVQLTGDAFRLWDAVEADSATRLIRRCGGIDFGPDRDVPGLAARLAAADVPHEVLTAAAAERRWPGMRFAGDVLFHAQAGTLDADAATRALLALATATGAAVRHQVAVTAIEPAGDAARVVLADGATLQARQVVVAAGAWLPGLLGEVVALPPLHVTQQQVCHFARLSPDEAPWPSTIHEDGGIAMYHLAGGGATAHRKLGEHRTRAPAVTPQSRSYALDPDVREQMVDYVRRWLPGLDPTPLDETTCLYTSTPSEDFLVDRVGPLVVCSPCSGHGAKFAPLIGEYVAALVLGGAAVPRRFSLAAHLGGRPGAVSL
jgi:sarcosine oxidase